MLDVEGACNPKSNRAGMTLEGLGDISLEQSSRFDFKTYNNQVEYKALIVGLKLGKEVRCVGSSGLRIIKKGG